MIKHSPEILTGLGIAGMLTTTILAVKATPKALKVCELMKEESLEETGQEPRKIEYVKATWKYYLPAAITATTSIACLIGASSVHTKRNAALATVYKLSETALSEYREKVVETIGEKKELLIRDKVAEERLKKDPVEKKEIFITGKGTTRCYDHHAGRYFESDREAIKRAENELNKDLLNEGYVSLNEFYDKLGLEHTKLGDEVGWRVEDGLIDIDLSSILASDGVPCLAIDYNIAPRYDYYKFG